MIRLGRAEIPPRKADADPTTPVVPRQRTESSVRSDLSDGGLDGNEDGTDQDDQGTSGP